MDNKPNYQYYPSLREGHTKMKEFKYSYDISRYMKLPTSVAVTSTRYFKLNDWLTANVGEFFLDFRKIGQDGYWMLCVNNEEDYVMFKLAFAPLVEPLYA